MYGHLVMPCDALQYAGQRLEANRIVVWNDFMIFAPDLRGDPDVRAALTDDFISQAPQGLPPAFVH